MVGLDSLADSESAWYETTVETTGRETVSFWQKVSSEQSYDEPSFSIDGVQQDALSGEQDWAQPTVGILRGGTCTSGSHEAGDRRNTS